MALKTRRTNGVTIFEPIGNHTYGSTDFDLKSIITNSLEVGDMKFLINLSGINKIDSTGIGEIVLIHQLIEQKRGILKLCNLSNEISSLMKMTRLNVKFEIFQTESKALGSFT